jgi:hypothetical protein
MMLPAQTSVNTRKYKDIANWFFTICTAVSQQEAKQRARIRTVLVVGCRGQQGQVCRQQQLSRLHLAAANGHQQQGRSRAR